MFKYISVLCLVMVSSSVYAKEVKFEYVITKTGYIHYMAEMTCRTRLLKEEGSDDILEEIKQTREKSKVVAATLDVKYGINRLSQQEIKRMVGFFRSEPDVNSRVMSRLDKISPTCDSELPAYLQKIMSRKQFVEYMGKLFCVKEKHPSVSTLNENQAFAKLSDREKNMIADAYTLSPRSIYEMHKYKRELKGKCEYNPSSPTTSNKSNVTDPGLKRMLNNSVNVINVAGLGVVRVGDRLIHKTKGVGVVKGLYNDNGSLWVAFVVNNKGGYLALSSKYFKEVVK